jgi:hypothetical protein
MEKEAAETEIEDSNTEGARFYFSSLSALVLLQAQEQESSLVFFLFDIRIILFYIY